MKISIDKSILWRALDQVSKVMSTRTIIPILSEILVIANDEGLSLTGGDGDVYLRTKIAADDFQLIRPGSVTIPGRRFLDIVKKLKDVIDITVDGTMIGIKSGRSQFEMVGMEPEEYPSFDGELGQTVKITGQTLKDLVSKTSFATYTKEDAPILTGLRIRSTEEGIEVTGTDRHRLSKTSGISEDGFEFETVVGASALNELIKIIPDKEKVNLSFFKGKFIVNTDSFVFSSRVLEGPYPDVDSITPRIFVSEVTVNTQELIDALEGVDIFAKEQKMCLVKMKAGEEIELISESDKGKANEFVSIKELKGEEFRIAFNAKFALSALKSIDTQETTINYTGRMSPLVIKGLGNETDTHLILPYRTEV
ncbi:DNA polymerase III subunit beta [Paenibacillus macerans]|uniref:DNA polymerase III subunit beta n=1 Tax=Paenibacillus macerans TaxID=44252 RepID=UPI002DBE1077|nr:DNA polymerase III subunit beta [Paenibacillus macerans]MEC0140448.1 DNA polymerase III subunit beta [Paenibacillus macerans]